MTPSIPLAVNEAAAQLRSLNLIVSSDLCNLWIYRLEGNLLRTFEIRGADNPWINRRDFDNWLKFMGFDAK